MKLRYMMNALALAILFLGICLSGAYSQVTVTIGTGTSTNEKPIDYYYYSSVSEALYTSTDMTTGGWTGGPGNITNVRWYVSTTSTWSNGTLYIYLENTTQTQFTSLTFSTGGTLVWTGPAPAFSVAGWYNFTLTTPYYYTGGNLAVRVVKAGTAWTSSYPTFRYTTATNMHRDWEDDVTTPSPTAWWINANRPNIQMVINPIGDPPPTISITSSPSGCVGTANQTVVSTITDNGSVAATAIWFKKNTGSWYNATPTSTVGSTYTFTINHSTVGGVVNGDIIYWYIGARDNNNNVSTSPWGGSGTTPPGSTPPSTLYSYTISAAGLALPYYQNFDGAPSGVTFGGTLSSWRIGAPLSTIGPTALSTPNALCCQLTSGSHNDNEQSWAILPALSFAGSTSDPVLTFHHKLYLETCCDGGRIETSTDCGLTWVTLGTVSDPNGVNWYTTSSVVSSNSQPVWTGTYTSTWIKCVRTLTGMAGKSNVQIRFRFCSDGSVVYAGWAIDDIAVGYFPQKDIELASMEVGYAPNRWSQNQTLSHTVRATIRNNGWEANPSSLTVSYRVGTPPTGPTDPSAVNQTFTPTWAGGVANLTFTTPYTPTATGSAIVYVKAFYTGDQNTANDQAQRTYQIQTTKVFGFEDFTNVVVPAFSTGWTTENVNGGNTWLTSTSGATGNGLTYPGDVTVANDWVYTPAANLQAGSSYRLQFKYRSRTNGNAQILDVAYGKAPNAASMTVFGTFTFTSSTFTNAIGPLGVAPFFNTDPAAAADYYVGFRVRSNANMGALDIDDIILDENPVPPPKIGYGPPGTAPGGHIDNAAIPIQLSAIYKKPGTIVKTYEVVSTTYSYGAPGDFLWDVTTTTPWIKITKSTANPTLYLATNPFTPPRPRQNQTFTMEIDPTTFAPGTYTGRISFYGKLYNAQYPTGIDASNQVMNVNVELTIIDAGSGKTGPNSVKVCMNNMTTSATPYYFKLSSGVPFAGVTVKSGTIQNMCIEVFPSQLPSGISRYRYVERYWQISAAGTGWTSDIDWYYTDTEANSGGVTRPDLLRCVRQLVSGGAWQDPTSGVVSTSYPYQYYVRGTGYSPTNIDGNHALVTSWFTPKLPADGSVIPTEFSMSQNYPNPFNPTSNIDFAVPEETAVKIIVYNSLGNEVARVVDEVVPAGSYTATFDGSDLPSGTYIYRMITGKYTETKRMMLAK